MKRLLCALAAGAMVLTVSATPAYAAKGGSQVTLKFWHLDGTTTATGFTSGTSADGGGKAVTVDGGSTSAATDAIYAVSFEGWWGQPLSAVSGLKISTQEPLTGGSPRISVTPCGITSAFGCCSAG